VIGVNPLPTGTSASDPLSVKAIRERLGLSQAEFAQLLGFSTRTIQSVEQGWRRPSSALRRMALLFLVAHLRGPDLAAVRCWEQKACSPQLRKTCMAYRARQGHLCWFLTGTLCGGKRLRDWNEKEKLCRPCPVFRRLTGQD